ncbi:hypothetical protein LCGC14_1027950 [marine sediment metagenome]|uniref:Nudix hydrolase domain-containing protein n=1 Tax=marine sediment metagenome TaxID=412755 RepID=A0A0F9QDM4_9ZZZZ
MKDEILACIHSDDIKYLQSGQFSKHVFPLKRKEAHLKKSIHLITRLFLLSKSPKGEIFYLLQKRGKNKKMFPEYFTDSSSGHVIWSKNLNFDEIKKNCMRELEEEFGIQSKAVLNVKFHNLNIVGDEIAYTFFGMVDYGVKLNPNPNELDVNDSKFYNRLELESILENEKNVEITKKIWKKLIDTDINSLFKITTNQRKIPQKKIALTIGRFQPLHHGHIYILKDILRSYKKVKIGIGSSQLYNTLDNPFTSGERKAFLQTALKKRKISSKKYEIFEIPDIFNAEKWIDHVISIVGEFNTVITNSLWVRELFSNKNVHVEKTNTIFKKKYNGKNIRNLILKGNKMWKSLVPKEIAELIKEFNGINRIKSFK